jgi:hypothetical protein
MSPILAKKPFGKIRNSSHPITAKNAMGQRNTTHSWGSWMKEIRSAKGWIFILAP